MSAHRYFVRVFSGGIENWLKDPPLDPAVLAKVFELEKSQHSVYEVGDGEEEWLVAAAHKLTDRKPSIDHPASVLRIGREHLVRFGIEVGEFQFGTTGVPQWDSRHQNLLADGQQLIKLVDFLANRVHCGHDYVRRIDKNSVLRALKTICQYPPSHCPRHVIVIAEWCMGGRTGIQPEFSVDQIKAELGRVEFEDDTIRRPAERISSGDQERDWYTALERIRQSYVANYIPAVKHRMGPRLSEDVAPVAAPV